MRKIISFLFTIISISCQAQNIDTASIDEDQYDQILPFLVADNHIKGLNLERAFERGDTIVYWLLVADTIGRSVTLAANRLPGLKFTVPFVIRAYGLNRVDSVLGSHVELFDPLWRPLIKDSLLIIRILQDTILSSVKYRKSVPDTGKSEIIVENSNGIEIEVQDAPIEEIKPD